MGDSDLEFYTREAWKEGHAAGKRRPDHCHADDCDECFGS